MFHSMKKSSNEKLLLIIVFKCYYFLFEIEKYISGLIAPGFNATIPLNSTVFTNISQYGPRQNRNDFDL